MGTHDFKRQQDPPIDAGQGICGPGLVGGDHANTIDGEN
jgi:hypothetical protein